MKTRRFLATVAELRPLSTWIRDESTRMGLRDPLPGYLDLCVHEAVANIVRHGRAGINVTVSLERLDGAVQVTIGDDGPLFDPAHYLAPVRSFDLESAPTGGFGIPLLRAFAQSLEYRRDEERNILVLRFQSPSENEAGLSVTTNHRQPRTDNR